MEKHRYKTLIKHRKTTTLLIKGGLSPIVCFLLFLPIVYVPYCLIKKQRYSAL